MQNTEMMYSAPTGVEDTGSAVSWSAIFAGMFAAVALSLVLITFGTGVGLAMTPTWSHDMAKTAEHATIIGAIWLVIVQWLSSGLGGYITGRMRTKWVNVHTHEVFFRDTAHGFLTWSVATVIGAVLLMFVAGAAGHHHMMGGQAAHYYDTNGGAPVQEPGTTPEEHRTGPNPDYSDTLFRGATKPVDSATRAEADGILMKSAHTGAISDADRSYLAQMIATYTAASQAEAEQRVDDAVVKAHQQADQERKAAASAAILTFLSMFIGAFIACVAAAIGGKERDEAHLLMIRA